MPKKCPISGVQYKVESADYGVYAIPELPSVPIVNIRPAQTVIKEVFAVNDPVPTVTSDYSSFNLSLGGQKTVHFTIANNGGETSGNGGYLSISASNGLDIVSWSSDDAPTMQYDHYQPGDPGWDKDGNPITLTYELLDAYETYSTGETRHVYVTFEANDYGSQWIKYRATFDDVNDPSSSSYTDQQRWPVYRIPVNGGTPPALDVDPTSLNYGTVSKGATPTQWLYVSNTGDGTLSWAATPSESWISVNPSSDDITTGGTTQVAVTIHTSDLSQDTPYSEHIAFTSNGGDQNVPVYITIGSENTIILRPDDPATNWHDAYVDESEPDTPHNREELHVSHDGGSAKETLIFFDHSAIPDDMEVISAILHLAATYVFAGDDDSMDINKIGYSLENIWSETTVTWNSKPSTDLRVDRVTLEHTGWVELDITWLVQYWYSNPPHHNHGLTLTSPRGLSARFASSEYSHATLRPYVEVHYAPPQPDFTLVVGPDSQTVEPGESTTYDVALTSENGFDSPVTLNVTGLPAGTTFEWEPDDTLVPPGTRTLDVTTSASTPRGTHHFSVTGSGGEKVHSAEATLQVGSQEGPTVTISNIFGNTSEPSGIVTIEYFTSEPNNRNLTTTDWQFTRDDPSGSPTWYDIEAAQISGDVGPLSPGGPYYIDWDTLHGTNNLQEVEDDTVWFRMKVDNGVAIGEVIATYYFPHDPLDVDKPVALTFKDNNLFVFDGNLKKIVELSFNGTQQLVYENQYTPATDAIDGIVWAPSQGYFYAADRLYEKMYKYSPNWVKIDSAAFGEDRPEGLTWDGEYIWMVGMEHDALEKFEPVYMGFSGSHPAIIDNPIGVGWDGTNLWAISDDDYGQTFYRYSSDLASVEAFQGLFGIDEIAFHDGSLWSTGDSAQDLHKHNVLPPTSDYGTSPSFSIDNSTPPTISGLPDQTLDEDSSLYNAIDLWAYAHDNGTPDASLTFTIVANITTRLHFS